MKGRKIMVVFVVGLMVALFMHPYANAQKEKMVSVEITKYNGNGIVEKKTIKMPYHVVKMLREKLINAEEGEQIKLLKEYGLISGDYDYSFNHNNGKDINTTLYGKLGLINIPVLFATASRINAIYIVDGGFHLGFPIAGTRKFFGSNIISYDLIDACYGALGIIQADGIMRSHSLITMPSILLMSGFIGIHIHVPLLLDIYHGFAAFAFAAGLGFHSINFNPLGWIYIGFLMGFMIGMMLYLGQGGGGGSSS